MNDVRKMIYGTIIGFFMILGLWFSIIYVSSCGYTLTCNRGDHLIVRTPIPTLIPSSHSDSGMDMGAAEFDKCQVSALDLIGAWVSAGSPETVVFAFTDANGASCEGTFTDDVQPLLVENGVWQTASLGCVSCHNADLTERSAGLDLTSYDAISTSGILGSNWENSSLHEYLKMSLTADGHSADSSGGNPLIFAGNQVAVEAEATPTP
ncbi:MAG TPA: hypothetical protein DCX53_09250 [Anaerolineae bacterium]|nr:hypothetical protein [Anaerolineae bacterium]